MKEIRMCSLEEAFPVTDGDEPKKRKSKKRPLLPPPEQDPDRSSTPPVATVSESPASWSEFASAPDPDYFHPDTYMLKAPNWAEQDAVRNVATPQPWFDMAPTLWQNIPKDWTGTESPNVPPIQQYNRLDELQNRIDSLFARLEATEHVRSESNHTEVILFILGGLFLLLILDLLVKQGTQASIWMANNSTPSFLAAFKGGRRRN
jgi:hypothetical protein